MKEIIANVVSRARRKLSLEKRPLTFKTIARKANRETLINELGGTTIAIMKNANKNIRKMFIPEERRIYTGDLLIFLNIPTTRIVRPRDIKNFDEPRIPIVKVAIQTSENNKAGIAVTGSIKSLCSSVKALFQDGG
jgi:hypothetical protein